MRRSLFQISFALAVLPCVLGACADAQVPDLSTDQAVRTELAKNSEFASALDSLCIQRLKESSSIIVIGTHAMDSDCEVHGAFVNAVYFSEDTPDLSQKALAVLGWEKANKEQREKLAIFWAEKGLLAFSTVLYTQDKDFDPYRGVTWKGKKPNFGEFHPPNALVSENGEIVVRMWVALMKRTKTYRHRTFVFTKNGSRTQGVARLL